MRWDLVSCKTKIGGMGNIPEWSETFSRLEGQIGRVEVSLGKENVLKRFLSRGSK